MVRLLLLLELLLVLLHVERRLPLQGHRRGLRGRFRLGDLRGLGLRLLVELLLRLRPGGGFHFGRLRLGRRVGRLPVKAAVLGDRGPLDEPEAHGDNQHRPQNPGHIPDQQAIEPVEDGKKVFQRSQKPPGENLVYIIKAHHHQHPADKASPAAENAAQLPGVHLGHAEHEFVLRGHALPNLPAEVEAVKKGIQPQRGDKHRQHPYLQKYRDKEQRTGNDGLGDAPLHVALGHLPAAGDAGPHQMPAAPEQFA